MTIEELYRWAKENGHEDRQIVIIDPLTTDGEYETKILETSDIEIPRHTDLAKEFYGTDNAILLI